MRGRARALRRDLPRNARVLVDAAAGQYGDDPSATGDCELRVDGSTTAISHVTIQEPGQITTETTAANSENGFALTAATDVLPAGPHTFELWCNQTDSADQHYENELISAIAVGAG